MKTRRVGKSYLWSLVDHIWSFVYGAYVCSGTQI